MSTTRTLDQLEIMQFLGMAAGLAARLGLVDAYPHYKVTLHACGFFATLPASLILNACLGASYYGDRWPYLVALVVTMGMLLRRRRAPAPVQPASAGGLSRRSFLAAGAGTLVTVGWGFVYSRKVELHSLEVIHRAISMPGLPPQLDGLKVVVMADWHCGPLNSPDFLRRAMEEANRQEPDLILLPGDFVERSAEYFSQVGELAALLRPRVRGGVLASLGNHDDSGAAQCRTQLAAAGVHLLENSAMLLTPERDLSENLKAPGLCVGGLGDLWTGKILMDKTLGEVPKTTPRLVMAHNPDTAELHRGLIDLMVSGHTHGGQVRFPVIGAPIVYTAYGDKYLHGLVQGPYYPVYVTRGIGVVDLPMRFGAPPEITVLRLLARPAR